MAAFPVLRCGRMSKAPQELLARIETASDAWSDHAAAEADRLDLDWPDAIEVARTAKEWRRERDKTGQAIDGWKDTLVGRDRRGRSMYLAGKWVYYQGERCWYVITFHENRAS